EPATLDQLLPPLLESAYRVALRLTGNPADAEDLVQEAAFLAAKGFRTFQTGTNFKAWFFRVMTNAFYSKYRRQKRQGEQVDLDDTPEAYLYQRTMDTGLYTRTKDPVQALMTTITTDQITEALNDLPEEYRVVSSMYFEEDMAYQDIAGVLEIPVGTVRSRLHRGRKLLQRRLWDVAVEAGVINQEGRD
ncbi:MAG: sigma-70 family RNA polymerase sigma factor, partial [Gemmatimonadetes bacterium]